MPCCHLIPILNLLEREGNEMDRETGIICDKAEGNIALVHRIIDFTLITDTFDLPNFIFLSEKAQKISCGKCWCRIERKVKGKVYNSSQTIY